MAPILLTVIISIALYVPSFGQSQAPQSEAQVPHSETQVRLSFAPIVKKTAPAVVNIYTKTLVQARNPFLGDPVFQHFFGERQFLGGPSGAPAARVQSSLGSGVLVRSDGIVITNNHVVEGSDAIKVELSDKRQYDAKIVAQDERTDLAALKLIGTNNQQLPFLELHDADTLEVGDLVLAIGNPYGIGQTVTNGIVSALARNQVGIQDFRSLIQTDAAINPGNSGGALVTMDGKLVGINTAIVSKSGGSSGVGFAIPSNLVAPILASVDKGGKVKRPWIGLAVENVTSEIAASLGLSYPMGVLIRGVSKNGPAHKAGLKVGDLLTHIDGQELSSEGAFRFRLAVRPIGATLKMKAIRSGNSLEFDVPLEEPKDFPKKNPTPLAGRQPLAGATVANLSPALSSELGLDDVESGVIILEIKRGSPVHRLGLMPGDVVESVNGSAPNTVNDLIDFLQRAKNGWALGLRRGDEKFTIDVRP